MHRNCKTNKTYRGGKKVEPVKRIVKENYRKNDKGRELGALVHLIYRREESDEKNRP